MDENINIQQTLTSNIVNNTLNLAADVFPGPIQSAINDYLNGVTIPLGSAGSLTVSGSGGQLTLSMSPVTFVGTASADEATLQVSGTGSYADASITVAFSKISGGVAIQLTATMGASLTWKISDIWPSQLNKAPFTDISLAQGKLLLTTDTTTGNIDFIGSGSVDYKGSDVANGTIRVLKSSDSSVQFMLGLVVPSWSPGSIWRQLNDVTFQESGLLFSSIPLEESQTLSEYNLISSSDVPAIVNGDFKVDTGITFFTNLQLTKCLAPLTHLLGDNQSLALYANKNLSDTIELMATYGASGFKPSTNAIFEFKGFSLNWTIADTDYTLTASSTGTFYPPNNNGLNLTLAGTIHPATIDISLSLSIDDWVNPFGYQKLTIKQLEVSLDMGVGSGGVTIGLAGDFQFTATTQGSTQTFEFGVAGSITDFEAISGVAFLLKSDSPGQMISLGTLVDGISGVNTTAIPAIQVINQLLQVINFDFALVMADSLTIGNQTFGKGFTLNADFDILNQENVIIDLEFVTGDSEEFTAHADLKQPVRFGNVLTLTGYDLNTKQPNTKVGPEIAVSSAGDVVKGVNDDKPVYFYLSAYVEFLDVIQAQLYGLATEDYLFLFIFDVQARSQRGTTGVWGGDSIAIKLDPKQFIFQSAFDFNFGWTNVTIGPVNVFGVPLIPSVSLANFSISAGLSVNVDGKAASFKLEGKLNFSFLSLNLSFGSSSQYETIVSLSLGSAPQKLDDMKDEIWNWLQQNIESLIEAELNTAQKFIDWIVSEISIIGSDILTLGLNVAEVLYNKFNLGFLDIVDVLVNKLGIGSNDARKIAEKVIGGGGCAATQAAKLALGVS